MTFWGTIGALGDAGRIQPQDWTAPSGDYVLCLGSRTEGRKFRVAPGAYLEIYQSAEFDTAQIVNFRSRTRSGLMPGDLRWRVEVRVDSTIYASRVLEPGKAFEWFDFACNASQEAAGAHTLAFRLVLIDQGSTTIPDGGIEVELPAWFIDDLSFDTLTTTPVFINRNPEHDHQNVARDANIAFDIVDKGASGIDLTNTFVWINGVLAYDGGTFQPGWAGASSGTSTPQANAVRLTIDPQNLFDSEQQIEVEVHSQTNAGAQAQDVWTFYVVDETLPILLSAHALTSTTVSVLFNEAMTSSDATASNDATNPANYEFESLAADGIPAVTPTVASVEKIADDLFIVTSSEDLTPDVAYYVRASNAEDAAGNPIFAPDNVGEFTFVLPRPEGRSFDLWSDMIPEDNKREDVTGDLRRFVRCYQEPTDLALYSVDKFIEIIDPDTAPEAFVDQMLVDMGNPFEFAASLSLTDKRRLIRVLPTIFAQKGLKRGIINVVRFFLGIEITIHSLSEDGWIIGEHELGETTILGTSVSALIYSFEITSPVALTDDQRDKITQIANYMKPAHTHLVTINEPVVSPTLDHWEIGESELGEETILH